MAAVAVAPRARASRLLLLTLILLAALALRLYRLDAVPLRGDETFTIRYMGGDPRDTLRDFVEREPYPAGGFLSVWAWKGLAGDHAFTMRLLPALGDWIGVAAVAALARRLFRAEGVARLSAALWAIHPLLIWHAQDARSNYALWAGLSALAMALFLRAAARNRPRDWALYLAAEVVAFYVFFLEAFVLVVQALYLVITRAPGSVWRRAVYVWTGLAALLLPWLTHVWLLSRSDYRGAIEPASPERLLTWVFGTLLLGDQPAAPWDALLPLAWALLVTLCLALRRDLPRRPLIWLAAWVIVPAALLYGAATRMSVFHPRYLLAVVPALLLLTARAAWPFLPRRRPALAAAQAGLLVLPVFYAATLIPYYRGDNPKSPDWPALAVYLDARAAPNDLILQAHADPSLTYYYRGPADETSLVPGADVPAQLRPQLYFYRTIWLVGDAPEAQAFLADQMQQVSDHRLGTLRVAQFRRWQPHQDEIAVRSDARFGDVTRLVGYTVQGPDAATLATDVLLYWEPLRQTEADYKVFVHLVPLEDGASSGAIWDQDDDRPLDGFASTRSWEVGALLRDPYHLLDAPGGSLPPGQYEIRVGMYDPDSGERLPVTDASGAALGDSYWLGTLDVGKRESSVHSE